MEKFPSAPTSNPRFTFPKSERLSSRKEIKKLFSSKNSQFSHPFKVLYVFTSTDPDPQTVYPQVLISVPKRFFKKAVDRNLIKRRIREAYRLNKSKYLTIGKKSQIRSIAIIYVDKKILSFKKAETQLVKVLQKVYDSTF